MISAPTNILGLTGNALIARAKKEMSTGAGWARAIYRDAVLEGRFAPERHGMSAAALAAWRSLFTVRLLEVVHQVEEPSDRETTTIKAVLRTEDGLEVECVRIPMGRGRYTLCVSSQVGCRMACQFCETAKMGLLRNLTAAEIVGQLVTVRTQLGWAINNIVFMGMGEPLDNVDEVMQALRIMHDDRGLSYGQPHLTVCTAGRPDGLKKLATLGYKRMDISLSLNAATDTQRNRLMPVNRRYPLAELQKALIEYPRRPHFVYAINYCLMPGINNTPADIEAVADFCRPIGRVLVNVIPYNPGSVPITCAPEEAEVVRFIEDLKAAGLPVRRRVTKGRSVMAACGQLGNLELRRKHRLSVLSDAG